MARRAGGSSSLRGEGDAAAELASLQRTRRTLEAQLREMDASMEELAHSDAVLAALGGAVDDCDGELSNGQALIRRISRMEASDAALVQSGWAVFLSAVTYIWLQRLFGFELSWLLGGIS